MAYIGASGALTNQATASDVFSGNGSNTTFTLSRVVYNTRDIEVVVNNVQQNPFDGSYSVSGQSLIFSGAPTAGANNIYVNHQASIVGLLNPTDNSVTANSIQNSAVTADKLHTTAVTDKLGYAPLGNTSGSITSTLGYVPLGNTSGSITTTLGYTPANKAGDAFTGPVVFANSSANSVTIAANGNIGISRSTPNVSLDIGARTDAIRLPVGNTAQRPTGNTGVLRYNSDTNVPEFFNNGQSAWVSLGALDGSSYSAAAPSASYIKNLGVTTSGIYWIKMANMTTPVQVYCDLSYDGGGYMLLAYGFVNSTGDDSANRAIPNLNHDGTAWSYNPTARSSTNGLVASPSGQKSALLIAKSSTNMIMAAGSNPSTGGIDTYTYVYRFGIPSPSSLTFNNHSYYYNGSMTNSSGFTVTGLKGDVGTWTRYTIVEAIGASWGDSYPTGYGCIESSTPKNTTWNNGPFFPSIHSGSRNIAPTNPTVVTSSPDVGVNGYTAGAQSYTYRGWYGAGIGSGQTGQTSIWVR